MSHANRVNRMLILAIILPLVLILLSFGCTAAYRTWAKTGDELKVGDCIKDFGQWGKIDDEATATSVQVSPNEEQAITDETISEIIYTTQPVGRIKGIMSCEKEHTLEVIAISGNELAERESFPNEGALSEFGATLCGDPFRSIAKNLTQEEFTATGLWILAPTEQAWKGGAAKYSCLIGNKDLTKKTGKLLQ